MSGFHILKVHKIELFLTWDAKALRASQVGWIPSIASAKPVIEKFEAFRYFNI